MMVQGTCWAEVQVGWWGAFQCEIYNILFHLHPHSPALGVESGKLLDLSLSSALSVAAPDEGQCESQIQPRLLGHHSISKA